MILAARSERARTLLATLLLAAGALPFGGQAALAEGLFRPANIAERRAAPQGLPERVGWEGSLTEGLKVLRTTFLVADPFYLRAHLVPPPTTTLSVAEREAIASRLAPEITLELFPDAVLRLRRAEKIFAFPEQGDSYSWYGGTKQLSGCQAIFMIDSGAFSGDITCGNGRTYYLNQINGNLYIVVEVVTQNS